MRCLATTIIIITAQYMYCITYIYYPVSTELYRINRYETNENAHNGYDFNLSNIYFKS